MARSRGAMLLAASVLGLAGLLTVPKASANVIGIDIGVDFMKVALVARGKPLEIVTNTASKRKTEVAVNFDRGERNFGSDAYALVSRKPKQTITKITPMLGRDLDHPHLAPILEHLPNDFSFMQEQGGVTVTLTDNGEEVSYSALELIAMVLSSAQTMTESFGYSVKDTVITVPEFATAHERRALMGAADAAELTVLSLMDENTAAALQHGISQAYEEDTNVLFFNMGANSLKVSIVTYGRKMIKDRNVGKITVRGKGWDATLGGGWFNVGLVNMLADDFNSKWGKGDVREFPRPMGKLHVQADKVKKVLSANSEIPVSMASLHDDLDFTTMVTRAAFEEISQHLLEQVTGPIDAALEQAGMTLADIREVEVIGGASRIPKVRDILTEYFSTGVEEPLPLGVHLNGDESPCLGAAFRGANLSRAFDVRKVGLTDITPWAVDLSLADIEADGPKGVLGNLFGSGGDAAGVGKGALPVGPVFKEVQLYGPNTPVPFKKTLSITRSSDFEVNVTYAGPSEQNKQLPDGTQPMIASYQVTGVAEFAKKMEEEGKGAPKVALRFATSVAGVPELVSAEAFVEYEKEVTYTEDQVVEEDEGEAAEASAQEGAAEAAASGTDGGDAADPEGSSSETGGDGDGEGVPKAEAEAEAAEAGSKSEDEKVKKTAKKKPKTVKVTKTKMVADKKKAKLEVVVSYRYMRIHPLTEEGMVVSKAKLAALRAADEVRKEIAQSKNELESYILKVRGVLRDAEGGLAVVSTEEQREEVIALASSLEEWLYDEGWEEDAATYRKKRAELAEGAEAIFRRESELKERPAELKRGRNFVSKVRESVEKWETTKPQITAQERKDVVDKIERVEQWMSDKEAEQASLSLHETPAFHSSEVEQALKPLQNLVTKLTKRPPPKKEKPAKTSNSTAEGQESSGEEGEGRSSSTEGAEGESPKGAGEDAQDRGAGQEEGQEGRGGAGDSDGTDPLREDEL